MEDDEDEDDAAYHVEKMALQDPPARTWVVILSDGKAVTFHRAKDAPGAEELVAPPGSESYRRELSDWCDRESAATIDTLLEALQACQNQEDLSRVAEAMAITNNDRAVNRTVSFCHNADTIAAVIHLMTVLMAVVTVYDGDHLFGGPAYANALLLNPVVVKTPELLRNALSIMVSVLRRADFGQLPGLFRTVAATNRVDDVVCQQVCRCADAVLRRASDACVDDFADLHEAHALYKETCKFLEEITATPLTKEAAPCVLRAMTVLLFHDQLPPTAHALTLLIARTMPLENERWDEVSAIVNTVGITPDALREALEANPHAAHLVVAE